MSYEIVDVREVTNELWATYKLDDGTQHCVRVIAIGQLECQEESDGEVFRE